MKKFFALLMALVLLVALAVPAFAAEVTITKPDVNGGEASQEQYWAYKIFDASTAGAPVESDDANDPSHTKYEKVAYTLKKDSPYADVLNTFGQTNNDSAPVFDLNTVDANGNTVVKVNEGKENYDAAELAKELYQVIESRRGSNPIQADSVISGHGNGNTTLDLTDGYYLIVSSVGSKMMVDTFGKDKVTIIEKNEYPTIDLIITEAQQGKVADDQKSASATVFYPVTWELTVHIPETANQDIYVVIEPTEQGTYMCLYNIMKDGQEAHTIIYSDNSGERHAYTIKIPADDVKANAGKDLVYTIYGDLTPSVTAEREYTMSAQLYYSNYISAKDVTSLKTFEVDLVKTNSSNDVLPGAKFQLLDAEGNVVEFSTIQRSATETVYRVHVARRMNYAQDTPKVPGGGVTEIEAGNVIILGLGEAKFTLKEIAAPAGYNPVTTPIEFTPEANMKATVTEGKYVEGGVEVENLTGAELPSTGGIGTTIFYIVGGLLVAGAVVLLVTKKRVQG